jgi:hypothetical protein
MVMFSCHLIFHLDLVIRCIAVCCRQKDYLALGSRLSALSALGCPCGSLVSSLDLGSLIRLLGDGME